MMVVVVLGVVMSLLDSTIVNVALRTLSIELRASLAGIQWVVTAYLLSVAAAIPVTGWAARRFGARRLYLASLLLFVVGSALCGMAQSSGELIALRSLQGIGAGMILPVGQMILVKQAGPQNMARVMGVIGVPIVLAPMIGPTIGGLLLDYAGWRWIFYVNVPIGIAAVILATRLLPRDRTEEAGALDFTGFATASLGMIGVTYGLAQIGTTGQVGSARMLLSLGVGLLFLVAFVLRSLRIESPLLDVRLYQNKAFGAASLATFCIGAAMFGGMILMPLYFQIVRGESPLATGLLLAPSGVGAAIASWLSGRATERLGGGLTALLGGVISTVATMPFVLLRADTSYVLIGAALVVRGFGIGMSMMPAMTAAYQVLEPAKINDATPQLSVLRQVGGSVGTAVFVVVLQGHLQRAESRPVAEAAAFGATFWWVLVVAAVATLPTILLTVIERRARTDRELTEAWGSAATPSEPAQAEVPR